MLAADGAVVMLTVAVDEVALFDASLWALASLAAADRHADIDDVPGASDYEDVSHASPSARPHSGSIGVASVQVYGCALESGVNTTVAGVAFGLCPWSSFLIAGTVWSHLS